MPTPTEIAKRLQLPTESEDDLKERVLEATQSIDEDADEHESDDPRDSESYAFTFNWRDSRGTLHHGKFVNQILNIQQRQQAGVAQASLQGGLPFEAFGQFHRQLNAAVAHMTFSLTERPSWAKNLQALKDPELVLKIWEEVVGHEATFWRHGEDEGQSAATSQDSSDSA